MARHTRHAPCRPKSEWLATSCKKKVSNQSGHQDVKLNVKTLYPPQRPDRMPEDMLDRMPEDLPDNMPEDMPDRMPEDMPDRIPEDMSDRMPEDMPDKMP